MYLRGKGISIPVGSDSSLFSSSSGGKGRLRRFRCCLAIRYPHRALVMSRQKPPDVLQHSAVPVGKKHGMVSCASGALGLKPKKVQ